MPGAQLREIVGVWLDEALHKKRWNPADLERATGVSRQQIGAIAGQRTVRPANDRTLAKLAIGLGVEPPAIRVDDGTNPGSAWPGSPTGVAMKVGKAVAHAIHETIERNELWYPGPGLRDLIAALHNLVADFTDRGIDTTDLYAAITYLREKQQKDPGRGDGGDVG